MEIGLELAVISVDFERFFMKYFKKVLVSALISASVCLTVTRAMPAAGWVGVGVVGLAATVGVPFAVSLACSREKGKKELHTAGPNQPLVTDDRENKVLMDFLGKYCKKSNSDPWDVKVDEKVKNKVVEAVFWDGKKYKTVEGDEAKNKADLEMLGTVYAFLSSNCLKEQVSCDGFKYGLSFGAPLLGRYEVFVSDDCKLIKVVREEEQNLCTGASVTLMVD